MSREFIASVILKCADVNTGMDILARAQFWEGFSGALPFHRLRGAKGVPALLRLIREIMEETSPGLSTQGEMASWSANGNSGFYKPIYIMGARMVEPRGLDGQDMMQADMSRDELPGSVFYAAGRIAAKNHQRDVLSGRFPPTGKAQAMAQQFMRLHAMDAIKVNSNRARLLKEQGGTVVDNNMSQDLDQGGWMSIISGLLQDPTSPTAKEFFSWMRAQAVRYGSPALLAYLDSVISGNARDQGSIAAEFGISDANLSQAKSKFFKIMAQKLSDEGLSEADAPRLLRDLANQSALHGLLRPSAPGSASMVMASEDKGLRRALIRLAHQNPTLRPLLLPILKQASPPNDPKAVAAEKLGEELQAIESDAFKLALKIEAAEKIATTAGLPDGFYDKAAKQARAMARDADQAFKDANEKW